MDVKAASRAKRASSQRGRARHSSHKHRHAKASPASSSSSSLTAAGQPQEPTPDPEKKGSKLPSNWSRYEEEEEEDLVEEAVPVKSKGANYRELLEEKSMFRNPDLDNGRKTMMRSRGLNILYRLPNSDDIWITKEMFDQEDSFFSLDLDFLDKALVHVDIADALFIDPKFIPEDQRKQCLADETEDEAEDSEAFSERCVEPESSSISTSERVSSSTVEPASTSLSTLERVPSSTSDVEPVSSTNSLIQDNNFQSRAGVSTAEPVTSGTVLKNDSRPLYVLDTRKQPITPLNSKVEVHTQNSVEPFKGLNDVFEPNAAEAELDALLDMLDTQQIGEAPVPVNNSTFLPVKSVGSVPHGSTSAKNKDNSSLETTVKTNVQSLNDNSNSVPRNTSNMNKHSIAPAAMGSSNQVTSSVTLNESRNPDDDFDNWLDSL